MVPPSFETSASLFVCYPGVFPFDFFPAYILSVSGFAVDHNFFSHHVVQVGFKLAEALLPQSPESWDVKVYVLELDFEDVFCSVPS